MRVLTQPVEAVSDGLTLPCGRCHNHTILDYRVTEEEWRRVVQSEWRLGVVCLTCFLVLGGRADTIEELQVVAPTGTVVFAPLFIVAAAEGEET